MSFAARFSTGNSLVILLDAVMTVGTDVSGYPILGFGYRASPSLGAITSDSLPGSTTLAVLMDFDDPATGLTSQLYITGFSSDPSANFFTACRANNVTAYSSAATYSYSSGNALWIWNGNFNFASAGGSAPVLIYTN